MPVKEHGSGLWLQKVPAAHVFAAVLAAQVAAFVPHASHEPSVAVDPEFGHVNVHAASLTSCAEVPAGHRVSS
jgi:hypothetical protein